MSYYAANGDTWSEVSEAPAAPPYLEIDEESPKLRFVGSSAEFQIEGAPARAAGETVHTVTLLDPSLDTGMVLCALRTEGQDLTVEDRRPSEARGRHAEAFDQLQSALDEILVPVYIDDALEEISESVDQFVVLHTAQYASPPKDDHTYFRTSLLQDGALLLEAERGAL